MSFTTILKSDQTTDAAKYLDLLLMPSTSLAVPIILNVRLITNGKSLIGI